MLFLVFGLLFSPLLWANTLHHDLQLQLEPAQGCHWYDLWGVPDAPESELEANFAERHDGLWGVYRFKRGFGGQIQRTIGATDRVYNKLVYKLYQWRRGR